MIELNFKIGFYL